MQGLKPKLRIQFGAADQSFEDEFAEWQGGKFRWRDRHRVIFQSRAEGLGSGFDGDCDAVDGTTAVWETGADMIDGGDGGWQ